MARQMFRFALLLMIYSGSAFAQIGPEKEAGNTPSLGVPTRAGLLESYFMVGSTASPATDTMTSYGGTNSSNSYTGKTGLATGFDGTLFFSDKFGFSAFMDFAEYFPSSSSPADSVFFLGVGPKFGTDLSDRTFLWGAFGIGFLRNRLATTQYTSGTTLITGTSADSGTYGISPRVGVDCKISERMSLRLQLAYTRGEFIYDFNARTYPGMANLGDGTIKLSRSWYTVLMGLHFSL